MITKLFLQKGYAGMNDGIRDGLLSIGVDIEHTMERFINNEALWMKFMKKFVDDSNMQELEKALEAKEYETVFRCAHTLKGITGNLGFDPLYKILCRICDDYRKEDYAAMDQLLPEVREEYAKVIRVMRTIE